MACANAKLEPEKYLLHTKFCTALRVSGFVCDEGHISVICILLPCTLCVLARDT